MGGNLTGLAPGHTVTLEDNGGSSLVLSSNGTFEFGTTLATGATYNVSVEAQPVGQTCTVTDGSGTIDAVSDVTNVNVACAVTASITGTLSGLSAGAGVTLSNGSTALPIAANGSFAFPGTLAPGSAYAVAVAIQPTAQTCTITDATGTVAASQIVSIAVICH
ncbi:MAG: hypothetical protein JO090_16140 [Rhizobacter sp.]|nr:hypothetical protein [Rhizobacter sp.]